MGWFFLQTPKRSVSLTDSTGKIPEEPRAWCVGLSPGMGEPCVQGQSKIWEGEDPGCLPHVPQTCSHHLAIHYPCPALPQNNFFGNASALFQDGMKVGFFNKFSPSFLKNAHFPPRTGIHERRSYLRGASNLHYPQSQQHPAIFKQIKNRKKKYVFKILIIKTKKILHPPDYLQKLICSCSTSARPSF